ncbi:MAG TPA: ferrous iron transport protein A [Hydrogenothermaceae bacterium]|nr:ferrous iron transport protein A [Hydrogenothermaceae bacterium]
MRLAEVRQNKVVKIDKLLNKNNVFVKRIEAMGLKKGERVKVEKKLGRNLILSLEGRKLAIDEKLAKEIEVKE